jgi:hypothetical protein
MSIAWVPWLLTAATAIWFGVMARRAERAWALWALGGAAFGLVTATLAVGLGESMSIPFTQAERHKLHLEWTVLAAVLIGGLGWPITLGLQFQHRALSKKPAETEAKSSAKLPSPTAELKREPAQPSTS